MSSELLVLAALSIRGVGPKTLLRAIDFINQCASLRELLSLCRERGARIPNATDGDLEKAMHSAFSAKEKMEQMNVTFHLIADPDFPCMLKNIPDPPLCLFSQGDFSSLNSLSLAVVGTRDPSDYGTKVAHRIGRRLAERSITVVSGLAEGCDTAGHEGCLEAQGKTVAFLAHGHGRIYPAINKKLANDILESGGCLVSEYPPGSPPMRSTFVQRDRLQSGSSAGIIVIETDIQGGTMHTVGFAESQKRCLAAVSHPKHLLEYPKTRGNQFLIEQKRAFPLLEADDLGKFIMGCAKKITSISRSEDELNLE